MVTAIRQVCFKSVTIAGGEEKGRPAALERPHDGAGAPCYQRGMSESEIPESDRLGGYPHPREVADFKGQAEAEQALFDAFMSGRMQHAWLLTGPKGIGKATLAYRRRACAVDLVRGRRPPRAEKAPQYAQSALEMPG